MSAQPGPGASDDDRPTPDKELHSSPEGDPSPEDLVLASGRDMTPENLEWAKRRIREEGRAALERELP